jgi:hypothetical protein
MKHLQVISGPLFPESWVQLDNEVAAAEVEWRQNISIQEVPVTSVSQPEHVHAHDEM